MLSGDATACRCSSERSSTNLIPNRCSRSWFILTEKAPAFFRYSRSRSHVPRIGSTTAALYAVGHVPCIARSTREHRFWPWPR